jgi:hypothetical protein
MLHISIVGFRAGHLVNARLASPPCISFDIEEPTARLQPSAFWVDCIASTGVLPDSLYFALFTVLHRLTRALSSWLTSANVGHRRSPIMVSTLIVSASSAIDPTFPRGVD